MGRIGRPARTGCGDLLLVQSARGHMLELLQVTRGVWVKPPSWPGRAPRILWSDVPLEAGGLESWRLPPGDPATHLVTLPLILSVDWSSPGPSPRGALVGPSCSLGGPVTGPCHSGPWFSTDFLPPVSLWSVIGKEQKGVGCNDHLFFKEFCYIQRKSNLMTVSNKNHVENVSRSVILKHGSSPQ